MAGARSSVPPPGLLLELKHQILIFNYRKIKKPVSIDGGSSFLGSAIWAHLRGKVIKNNFNSENISIIPYTFGFAKKQKI
jgi:hypothetical protein